MEKNKKDIYKKFQIINNNYSIWKTPKRIISFSGDIDLCPNCESKLNYDYTLIPISKTQKAKVFGKLCRNCNSLYINNKDDIHSLLLDNAYSKEYTLDGVELWNYSFKEKQKKREEEQMKRDRELQELNNQRRNERYAKLEAVASAEVMICIQYVNRMIDEIIIVNDPQYADEQKNIFHYLSDAGREFLSAAFAQKRNRRGIYNGMNYRTIEHPLFKDRSQLSLSHHNIMIDLRIKTDGGLVTSLKNNNFEIVNMLLYSPFSQKYEIVKATHNKSEEMCFVDISVYRNFVHKYGNPELIPLFETRKTSSFFDDLNQESILKGYGYVVNQKDNLSSEYRQKLLAEIIDLNILTASSIIHFLNFLISTHTSHPYAQCKWREDIHFVENYKANPKRFLIAKEQF